MKKPFFLPSLSFTLSFFIGMFITIAWPIPQEAFSPAATPLFLGLIVLILGILGVVAFAIGIWTKHVE